MKRKLMKSGEAYLMSLPIDWVRKHELSPGDELEVERRGNMLNIAHNKEKSRKRFSIKLNGNKNQIVNNIVAVYRKGADEIELTYNSEIADREGNTVKTGKLIQDTVNELIGIRIVEQKPNFCLIQDVTKTANDSFDAILKRMFFLLLSISEESMKAIENKDKKALEEIQLMFYNVRQFTNYALRLLNKHEHIDHTKTVHMYAIVNYLNEMADSFRHIAKHYSTPNIRIPDDILAMHQDLNKLVRVMYETFYDLKEEKMAEFFEMRDKVYLEYRKVKPSNKLDGVLENIGYVRQMITNLMRERMGM